MSIKKSECRKQNVIYDDNIETNNDSKVYVGLTNNKSKNKRFATYKTIFKNDPDQKNR